MQNTSWLSRRARSVKVRDPLYLAAMLAMSCIGVAIGISEGGSARETLIFIIFAMVMLYMAARR